MRFIYQGQTLYSVKGKNKNLIVSIKQQNMLFRTRFYLTLEGFEMSVTVRVRPLLDITFLEAHLVTEVTHSIFGSMSNPCSSTALEIVNTANTFVMFKNKDISAR